MIGTPKAVPEDSVWGYCKACNTSYHRGLERCPKCGDALVETYEYEMNVNGSQIIVTPRADCILLRRPWAQSSDYLLLSRADLEFMISVIGNRTEPVTGPKG